MSTRRNNPIKFDTVGACFLEFGAGKIARLEANFLATDTPSVVLVGPSIEFRRDKEEFESSRRDRWVRQ